MNSQRIYISPNNNDVSLINKYISLLQKLGHKVTVRKEGDTVIDIVRDVAFCNIIILVGKNNCTELGVALGLLKDIYVISDKETSVESYDKLFFTHPSVELFNSWDEMLNLYFKS